MSKEEAERLLNAFKQDEQELQQKLRKQSDVKRKKPKKDW